MPPAVWLVALLTAVGVATPIACRTSSAVTTVYLVRHAEKASGGGDPVLTEQGAMRAKALIEILGDARPSVVFATQYRRTRQTVMPFAEASGIAIEEVRASEPVELAERIRTRYRGQTVLAAAHSNTLPTLIAALGVLEPVVIGPDDYGDLFVVTLYGDGRVTLTRRRFGD